MILIIDNYDSFTFNLLHYFEKFEVDCELIEHDLSPAKIDWDKYHGVVLSPGPGTPEKAGYLMQYINEIYKKKPILGVCLGHQALCVHKGARLVKAIKPMHGKISVITHNDQTIFKELPNSINVVRYHSLVCDDIPDNLQILAATENKEVMAVKDCQFPVWGLQFHPEAALTQGGMQMIGNWLRQNQIIDPLKIV